MRYYREMVRSGCNFDGEGICGYRGGIRVDKVFSELDWLLGEM